MLNNKNEVESVLPIRNFNGGYMKKTYIRVVQKVLPGIRLTNKELIENISPDKIDALYYYLAQLKEKNVSKDAEVIG